MKAVPALRPVAAYLRIFVVFQSSVNERERIARRRENESSNPKTNPAEGGKNQDRLKICCNGAQALGFL